MSSTSNETTSSSETTPKFPSKDWFLKNKVLVGIVVAIVLIGAGVGIYFAVRPKNSGSDTTTGGLTDTGNRKNGKWSEWSTECVKQGNQWVRTRTCLEEGQNGGLLCSQIDGGKSTQVCDPIAGQWRIPPDSDSVCKLENGKWVKERFCDNPAPQYGGATCQGSNKVDCTPMNGYWFPSLNDAVCEVAKDEQGNDIVDNEGRTKYYKTLTCIEGQFGGQACPARTEPGTIVKGNKAMIPCEYRDGTWSEFSACEASGTDQIKTRTCSFPEYGGRPCVDYYPLIDLVKNNDSEYIVSASSVDPYGAGGAYEPWNAFDSSTRTYWHSADSGTANTYTATTGVYRGSQQTTVGSTVYHGEWIQIQFPDATIHTRFRAVGIRITPRDDSTDIWTRRSPRNFVLLGSQNETAWTVIFDNTLLTGIKDWTASRKTIYFPTPAVSGYNYYRLVITRVGNFDTGTGMQSVQIADLRIIGSPIVPKNSTTPVTQTSETIPCNRDCLYGEWENKCTYNTGNNKLMQTRPKISDPVGKGASCQASEMSRICPGVAATWNNQWGAFSSTERSKGTPSEFKSNEDYIVNGENKQVMYARRNDDQNCPTDATTIDGNMCYKYRNRFSDWGACVYNAQSQAWQRTRKDLITNTDTVPVSCIIPESWGNFPDGRFIIRGLNFLVLRLGPVDNRFYVGVWDPFDPNQIFEYNSSTKQLTCYGASNRALQYVSNGAQLIGGTLNNSDVNQQFQYDSVRKMIRNVTANKTLSSDFTNGSSVIATDPNANLLKQRWEVIPAPTLPSTRSELKSTDERLGPGQYLQSPNGRFVTIYQYDGHLVTYNKSSGFVEWSTSRCTRNWNHTPGRAVMQPDGNFVVYNSSNGAIWSTRTNGINNSKIVMQDDSNLVVYDASGRARWARTWGCP